MVAVVRSFLIFIVIVAVIFGAAVVYLTVTTPHQSAGIRFPLTPEERALLAQVPASAQSFALIPAAAALDAKLRANPITRDALDSWSGRNSVPRPWMFGSADLLAWKSGDSVQYFLRLDPFRAFSVRVYSLAARGLGKSVRINVSSEPPMDSDELARILDLAGKLPPGDALVVQRESGRGSFPPIGRPTVTSVQVTATDVNLTSIAAGEVPAATLNARLPRAALLAVAFTSPPRMINDLNRLFGAKISSVLSDGGAIALYDIDTGKLLPRPIGVIVVPADAQRRADFDSLVKTLHGGESLGYRVRTAERGGELLLSFDESIDQYLKDRFDEARVPGGQWAVVIDPKRLLPILGRLSDNIGLRVASPRLFRAARDLEGWITPLQQAERIEANDSTNSGLEELRVHLAAK
ncbi:MAG: hypothetical protein DMF57_03780 [Acidobacteria bacterium]|nr:MAG: hypothetical protein DMF57_03780 [Acidobacteriota bacterium]